MAAENMTARVVVLTGASAGIGAAGPAALGELGATVVPVGRNQERLEAVAKRVRDGAARQASAALWRWSEHAVGIAAEPTEGMA